MVATPSKIIKPVAVNPDVCAIVAEPRLTIWPVEINLMFVQSWLLHDLFVFL
jgi:hypothetical protein